MSLHDEILATEAAVAASDARLLVWREEARRTVRERLMPSRRTLMWAGGGLAVVAFMAMRRPGARARLWRGITQARLPWAALAHLPWAGPVLPMVMRVLGVTR